MPKNNMTDPEVKRAVGRLAKVCGMLGSNQDGERASAALLATQILESLEISWSDLIQSAFKPAPSERPINHDQRPRGWHVDYCKWLISNHEKDLSEWEASFIRSLVKNHPHSQLSKKQSDCFVRIAKKYGLEI